ncbi:MAG: hypothetical protein KF734_18560 [Saprospiraceae bacterium]|nr:hypothetical protein [Saprospiraceae bacterium]
MQQEEKTLNPQESLRLIRETIDLAKRGVGENGFQFLWWGWLVVVACLAEYYMLVNGYGERAHLAWMVMPLIGAPGSLIYEWRRDQKQQEKNIVRELYGYLWLGFGISLVLTLVISVLRQIPPVPMVLVLAGFATFMSGILIRFRPLVFGGLTLWAGAALCLFVAVREHSLVEAGAVVLGYLLPGYWLNHKARKHHV